MVAALNVMGVDVLAGAPALDRAEIARARTGAHRLTINGLPKFRFFNRCHDPSEMPPNRTEPIEMSQYDCQRTGRNPGFVNKVRKLAARVENELPDNVQVSIATGPLGGLAAWDQVEIRVLGPDGTVAGVDRFFRTNGTFEAPGLLSVVPKKIRDNLFMSRIFQTARRMAAICQKNPKDSRLNMYRPYDGFVGYW